MVQHKTLKVRERLIAECKEQIEKYGKALPDVLSALYTEGKRFVLVGENHTQIDAMHKAVQAALPQLREQGVTHLFLEIERDMQAVIDNLDASKPDEEQISYLKSSGIRGIFTSEENLRTMVLAKKLGFKIVFIDDPKSIKQTYVEERIPYDKREYMDSRQRDQLERQAKFEQDARDGRMFETVQSSIDGQSKGLMIIGSVHVRKTKGEPTVDKQVWVRRVGSRMSEQYGDQVSSIRYLHSGSNMDDIYGSNKPAPKDLYPELQTVLAKPTGVTVMRDDGLFAGDKRVTDSDFVLIPTAK